MLLKKVFTLFLSMVICFSMLICQFSSFSINAEESYLPAIQDDTGTITEEMKEVIWAKYEEKYPDTDCSDFTLVYFEEDSVFAASGTNYYGFLPYYKDTILIDSTPRITVTADGEMTATVIEEAYVNYCLSLDDSYLSEAEIMEYVCYEADSHLLAENLQSVSLIIGNFYGYGIALAYELVYVYADSNCHRTFYLNAYTGLGMYYINDWDDGLQYGWTGMLRLSCTVENDAYLFAVQGPYKSREVYLADAETGETLGTMTSDDTSDTAPYTCTYSLALDADEGTQTVYAYVNHTGSFLNTEQEVSNYVTLSANGTSTETTVATETTVLTEATTSLETETTTSMASTTSFTVESTEDVTVRMIGDINLDSKITVADVVYLHKAVLGAIDLNEVQKANADVYADGKLDSIDALCMLKFIVNLIDTLPVTVYPVENPEVIDEFTACTATIDDDFDDWMFIITIKCQYSDPNRVWTVDDFVGVDNIKSIKQDEDEYMSNHPYRTVLSIYLENDYYSKEHVLEMITQIETLNLVEIKEVSTFLHGTGVPDVEELDKEEWEEFFS